MDTVTVCSECLQASCWQGVFMCDRSQTAGTIEKTIKELKKMNLYFEMMTDTSLDN